MGLFFIPFVTAYRHERFISYPGLSGHFPPLFLQIWRNRPLLLLRSGNGQIFLANKINVGIITRE
jgi:hypothetical protein